MIVLPSNPKSTLLRATVACEELNTGWMNHTHKRISEIGKLCLSYLWGRITVKIQQLTPEQIASWKPGHI